MGESIDHSSLAEEASAKGLELLERGWTEEALRYLRKATEHAPDEGLHWDNLALGLTEAGDLRGALACYLKAVELDPDVSAARYNLAGFLVAQGPALAEAELRESLRIEPGHADALLTLGMVLSDAGRGEEALPLFEEAATATPDDALPHHEAALLLMDQGRLREALTHLREVVRLEPENREAWLDLASCWADRGFTDEARRALDEAERLGEEQPEVHYQRALVEIRAGDADAALARLRRAAALEPERVREWLGAERAFDPLRARPDFATLLEEPEA